MRAIIAHFLPLPELIDRAPFGGRSDDLLVLGAPPSHLEFDPLLHTWEDVRARLPSGWDPDAYIHWSLEYNPPPIGIEDADCLTVATVGDWNLGGQAVHHLAGAFDLLIADNNGCDHLRSAGFSNVEYAPLWAFDPAVHRTLDGVDRDLDIVMVGSFNHEVQHERSRWIARVARMSDRFRVCITTNVYGDDYVRLMNRARIVFNRSIRGELNMRAYEAAACGALMFYERGNPEIETLFTPGEECVLYDENDLEDLLAYYLAHEDERARIAANGLARVQSESYQAHLAQTLQIVEHNLGLTPNRPLARLPLAGRKLAHACHRLLLPDRRNAGVAMKLAEESHHDGAPAAGCLRVLAVAAGELAAKAPHGPARVQAFAHAAILCRQAGGANRLGPAEQVNLASFLLEACELEAAMTELELAAEALQSTQEPAEVTGPYFPRAFREFDVALDWAWATERVGSEMWTSHVQSALLSRAAQLLSECAGTQTNFISAAKWARMACGASPHSPGARHLLARMLQACGRMEDSAAEYRAALDLAPFNIAVWLELPRVLSAIGKHGEAAESLANTARTVDGCPFYAWMRPALSEAMLEVQSSRPQIRSGPFRFVAVPDWRSKECVEQIVGAYVDAFGPQDEVTLDLHVDPVRDPSVESLYLSLEQYLADNKGMAAEAVADITLSPRHYNPEALQSVLDRADALIISHASRDPQLAARAGIPAVAPTAELLSQCALANAA